MEETRKIIRTFVGKYIDISQINDDADLFGDGYVNSLFAMQLLMFLERKFEIEIRNEELNIDNFKSISALVDFVINQKNK